MVIKDDLPKIFNGAAKKRGVNSALETNLDWLSDSFLEI
jgi:hypothetical protein